MESSPDPMLNAFTVDVEDYFQVSAFESSVARERWTEFESRVVANTLCIADLLEETHVHGTFFILGWVAERFPDLVRELHSRGHEIGSHSYWHRLIYSQSPEEFREDQGRLREGTGKVRKGQAGGARHRERIGFCQIRIFEMMGNPVES